MRLHKMIRLLSRDGSSTSHATIADGMIRAFALYPDDASAAESLIVLSSHWITFYYMGEIIALLVTG